MSEQYTDTGKTLVPESYYEAMITAVVKKEPKGFLMYEWKFETLKNDKLFYFSITLFASQMSELLKALGAEEVTPNRFKWDDEKVIGNTISFNLVHVADKKGVIREQLSDIKLLTQKSTQEKTDIAWGDDKVGEVSAN